MSRRALRCRAGSVKTGPPLPRLKNKKRNQKSVKFSFCFSNNAARCKTLHLNGGGKYEKVTSLFEFKVILNQVLFQFGAIFGCKNLAALFFETNELV